MIVSDQILFTPAAIPKITIEDWADWWHIWNMAQPLKKIKNTHNDVFDLNWKGLLLKTKSQANLVYQMPQAPQTLTVQRIIEQVQDHLGISDITICVVENLAPIPYHADHTFAIYEFRSLLWNTYPDPVWQFRYQDTVFDMVLPQETNSFLYLDHVSQHRAQHQNSYTKGLLSVTGITESDSKILHALAIRSAEIYAAHAFRG